MIPKAIRSPVMAMARPRRPASEREAVRGIAKGMADLSAVEAARQIAKAVVSAYLADMARTDDLERALANARQVMDPDPAHDLATAFDSAVAVKFAKERLHRFEARGCQQLGPNEWQRETRAIAAMAEKYLARRYRDFLQ